MKNLTLGVAPRALPLFGHAHLLMRRPVEFLTSLSGHGGLVQIRLGTEPVYVVCDAELLQHVLANDATFDKGGVLYHKLRELIGDGLGGCAHKDHRRQRRLMQPAFATAALERHSRTVEDEARRLVTRWHDGDVIDAHAATSEFALRLITRVIFSAEPDAAEIDEIRAATEVVVSNIVRRMLTPAALRLFLPGDRRYAKALALLHSTVDARIADVRRSGHDRGDMLSTILLAEDPHSRTGFDDREVHDQILTVMAASSEAVASLLSWAMYFLAVHPQARASLRGEVDAVLGGRPPTWRDLPRLTFTDQVVSETLRLRPPGWIFTRVATTDVELAGHRLPAGTTLLYSPLAVQCQEALYQRPADFDPHRWDADRTPPPARIALVPFGGGARRCIGDRLARVQATIALAMIASEWTWESMPGTDPRPAVSGNLRPRRVTLTMRRRPRP